MEKTNFKNLGLIIIAVSVVLFSISFLLSAKSFSKQGSYVEVKGLAEKIVKSDVAIWSMNFEIKSNDVDSLYASIEKDTETIKAFLIEKGFDKDEINVAPINVYQDTYKEALYRYNANVQMSIYTDKVDLARSSSQDTLSLIKKGVTINYNNISFDFTDLNTIKPQMLTEAIANAKDSAIQFAQEAGSEITGISRGNQGVFSINDKDPGSPEYKKVRVVSTLRFLLK